MALVWGNQPEYSIEATHIKSGGSFDVGITITDQNGAVKGYGIGDTRYVLKDAISISAPEALITLRNSRVSTGLAYRLAYIVIGLTSMGIGLSALLNLLIKYLTS